MPYILRKWYSENWRVLFRLAAVGSTGAVGWLAAVRSGESAQRKDIPMLQVQLPTEEALLLREILENYLGALRGEVYHTDSFEYREELKHEEATLKQLLQQFQTDMASV
jgi:hypothetical protein